MKRHSQSRGIGSAFTLIELLVVIAIIAILAAILFPVFAKAREKARQTACLSNAKQLGLSMVQYTSDYDETYPNGSYKFGLIAGWANQVYPYVKSTGAYVCPDDPGKYAAYEHPSNYAMNVNFGKGFSPTGTNIASGGSNVAYNESDLNAVAKTVLLFEIQGNHNLDVSKYTEDAPFPNATYGTSNASPAGNGLPGFGNPGGGGSTSGGSCVGGVLTPATKTLIYATGYFGGRSDYATAVPCTFTGPTGVHSDGSNYVMADGHAKWARGASVSPGQNAYLNNPQGIQNTFQSAGTAGYYPDGVTQPALTFSLK